MSNEDRNSRNGTTVEIWQQAGNSGLLEDALRQIKRRDGAENKINGQRVDAEEYRERRNREDESALEELAKKQRCWLEDADAELKKKYGEMIGHGAESFVYRKDDETVIKSRTIDPNVGGGYRTYQEALDSIAIHNKLFPETAMDVAGFGRSEGEFCVIINQPYIEGYCYATTETVMQYVAENFDAEKDDSVLGGQSYKNGLYLLQDLKPKNVIVKDVDGCQRLFVIDGDFYYAKRNEVWE